MPQSRALLARRIDALGASSYLRGGTLAIPQCFGFLSEKRKHIVERHHPPPQQVLHRGGDGPEIFLDDTRKPLLEGRVGKKKALNAGSERKHIEQGPFPGI